MLLTNKTIFLQLGLEVLSYDVMNFAIHQRKSRI